MPLPQQVIHTVRQTETLDSIGDSLREAPVTDGIYINPTEPQSPLGQGIYINLLPHDHNPAECRRDL